jgi:predicted ATPase/DNA-binding SARP family transcriptional activator/Tfp pilus assembly protein PilF
MRRPLTLLAYLAVEVDRPHPREGIADLFWPEASTSDARRNLRQLLYRLRQLLHEDEADPPHLVSDSQALQFNAESSARVDVVDLPRLMADVNRHSHRRLAVCPVCAPRLEAMIALYRGRFMEGWDFSDGPALERWVLMTQESLARSVHRALHALGERYLAHDRGEDAQACAQRLLQFDPWDEGAERLLLRSLVAIGHRNRALREYGRFRAMLARELDLPPEDETQTLAKAIRDGMADVGRSYRPPLPMATAPLVGRTEILGDLTRLLTDREHRLLTLLGPGGSGKTRLALHVAETQMPDWQDGVGVISLAEVARGGVDGMAEAIGAVLDVPGGQGQSTVDALLAYLHHREILLILDNFEHLLPEGARLLRRILRHAPHVKLLVTSQVRLNLPEEWALRIGGLTLPPLDAQDGEELRASSESMVLFAHHACRVDPRWELTAENRACVSRICHLVEGLPLALELAAVWIRGASACRIAEEIADTIDFLRSATPHRPARQRSLAATFTYAYDLLSEEDRALFRRLSVFPGSFLLEDARAVADASLPALARLLDRSLIRLSETDRWDLHPLLRRYAAERLGRDPAALAALQAQHARLYLDQLVAEDDALWGEDPQRALTGVTAEWENVRAAWRYALSLGEVDLLRSAAGPLARYLDFKGLFQWGVTMFDRAARDLASDPTPVGVRALMTAVMAHFLMRQAAYDEAVRTARSAISGDGAGADATALAWLVEGTARRHLGDYGAARDALTAALRIARDRRMPRLEAEALRTLGAVQWRLSAYETAQTHYRAALTLDRELGDRRGEGWSLNGLGLIAENQGAYDRALRLYRDALTLVRGIGDLWGESIVLGNLGYLYARLGDGDRARAYYRQDLGLCRSLGDRRGESWTQGYLSLLAHQEGRHRAALQHGRRALALAREVGHDPLIARAYHAVGCAWVGLEGWDEADRAYRKALALRREAGADALVMETRVGLVRVALGRGAVEEALTAAETILAYLVEATAARTDEQLRIYLVVYRALAAASDPRACSVLEKAGALLETKAAKIEDPALRDAFLNRVAVHREVQALVDREL